MRRRKLAPLLLCLPLACPGAHALTGAQEQRVFIDELCPVITVECPESVDGPGTPVTFRAKVQGAGPKVSPTFDWTVSAGAVESGQGTPSVVADTTGLTGGSIVTATIKVGGLDRSCSAEAACTTAVLHRLEHHPLDTYGDITLEHEEALLDNFAIELQNLPHYYGYIACYGGRRGVRGEARARCERAKAYLVKRRNIAADRVVLVDGGFREKLNVVLWVWPPGAQFQPTPTVAAEDVEFIRKPPRRRGHTARARRGGRTR